MLSSCSIFAIIYKYLYLIIKLYISEENDYVIINETNDEKDAGECSSTMTT